MRINVVFNLETVNELKHLTEALAGTVTLQTKIRLTQELKSLQDDKNTILTEIREIKKTRAKLKGDDEDASGKWEIESLDRVLMEEPVPELPDEVTPDTETVIALLETDEVEDL